jgi:hypothetical protein
MAELAEVLAFATRIAKTHGIEIHFARSKTKRELLWFWPKSGYDELPRADRDFIRGHKPELKELVRSGLAPRLAELEARNAKLLECPFCQRACVGREHPGYDVLHNSDPEVVARRTKHATKVMFARLGVPPSVL